MESLKKLAKQIKLLILDCDGVLTTGKIYVDAQGNETIAFYVRDGFGIEQLQASGIAVAVISGRDTPAVKHRLKQLKVAHVFLGRHEQKVTAFHTLLKTLQLQPEQVAYIGDDVPDIAVMKMVGLPVAVADAMDAVKAIAMHCTHKKGGKGAVREICDLIIDAHNEA